MKLSIPIPILGFAAYSGTGKTTLLEALLPRLTQAGLRIGMLKHAHHNFDVDKEGKDSFRLRKAGASQMLVSSRHRHALMTETPEAESEFDYLLSRFDTDKLDVILVEGCKNIAFPKIELHREEVGKPWLHPNDSNIIAIVADTHVEDVSLPQMNIKDLDAIARFVCDYVKLKDLEQATKTSGCCDTLSPAFLSVSEGQDKILSAVQSLKDAETCTIEHSYGRVLFSQGKRLESPQMGMFASLGVAECPVFRRLKVAVFSTGDEVQTLYTKQAPKSIYDSNRFTLLGLLERLGCEILDLGILEYNQQSITEALQAASSQADAIITSGGVSVGDTEFIKLALDKLGSIDFWRIKIKPSRQLGFGKVNNKPFFGLPGHPLAVMVSFINFIEPALRKMQGEQGWQPLKVKAAALEALHSCQGRTEFSPGVYHIDPQGKLFVRGTGKQGSDILRSMSEANCLIEVSPAIDTVKVGESVTIIPLQGRI
ncbi:molybdopterin-guanine dinucleotide biosynthesis protein B [Vibrio neptunius]|uniref:Molybdopterin molybdenumtransferase n=1 Tax=Vibrio neptunius TaxID=170651 RepID=A0ABS2ZXQ4_9VIBR|nr:molybdopterin-guanine dinucleotide biosynthesis protein B [Vibrio neptunius]MBN3491929.1 molybdopterin-guanine dinucleotide biosynthesis protein B [Vibrio neptunius]MBN3514376.1 molybdopterin-guanine dinucleotide biosynthesis protein B [Vibrio neptunius]MBN3548509.1 molybdopterin-guanine dinucleotide biosynthesis protein B [Vibrio neptunius]MBN3576555.1 molybdopterin-guanine dinucleotide biosynthesis protein B [Vibrio neptunius]MCH9870219.1 molybdopterin-guanine dinucleotide biosynthesis pr